MARVIADLRRQDFIEAAISVIAEHGVAQATTRRIAAAANAPLGSLHYVFRNKEELFYAVYEFLFNATRRELKNTPASGTAAEATADLLRQLVQWFIAHPTLAVAQSELFTWIIRNKPAMARSVYAMATDATEQGLQRVTASHPLSASQIRSISHLLLNLFEGLILAWAGHGDPGRLESETETACNAVKLLVDSYCPRTLA